MRVNRVVAGRCLTALAAIVVAVGFLSAVPSEAASASQAEVCVKDGGTPAFDPFRTGSAGRLPMVGGRSRLVIAEPKITAAVLNRRVKVQANQFLVAVQVNRKQAEVEKVEIELEGDVADKAVPKFLGSAKFADRNATTSRWFVKFYAPKVPDGLQEVKYQVYVTLKAELEKRCMAESGKMKVEKGKRVNPPERKPLLVNGKPLLVNGRKMYGDPLVHSHMNDNRILDDEQVYFLPWGEADSEVTAVFGGVSGIPGYFGGFWWAEFFSVDINPGPGGPYNLRVTDTSSYFADTQLYVGP